MARPARVRMRRRKPCVLARRRLFGWKVRLLTRISVCLRVRDEENRSSTRWWALAVVFGDRNRQARGDPAGGATGRNPRSTRASVPWACESGRRHARSTIREPWKTGQTSTGRPPMVGPGSERKSTRRRFRDLWTIRLWVPAGVVRFSTLTIVPPPCTGCGQTCGQQGRVHRKDPWRDSFGERVGTGASRTVRGRWST